MDSADEELNEILAARTAAQDQLNSSIATWAQMLASFRTQLIVNGFTTSGAEDHTLEWFVRLLDAQKPDDED